MSIFDPRTCYDALCNYVLWENTTCKSNVFACALAKQLVLIHLPVSFLVVGIVFLTLAVC